MKIRLGVNIDHVATLRQARRAPYPDPVDAAAVCLSAGAYYIVAHWRKDERHINEKDIALLCKSFPGKVHLECSFSAEAERIALKYKPHAVCIVPEEEGEITTTGGLKFTPQVQEKVRNMAEKLHKAGILVSLFISPTADEVRIARRLGADIIELCTRDYSEAPTPAKAKKLLQDLSLSALLGKELGLEVHAGHGLDYINVMDVADIGGISGMNIGFAIITRALFAGLPQAVEEMKDIL